MRVLVMPGLTLPEVTEADLEKIRGAAGADAEVVVASNREDAMAQIPEAEVLLGYLTEELFAAAEKLEWVHATASGVDGYLFDSFKGSEIPLTGEKGLVGPHLADHAFALLLALARSLTPALRLKGEAWGSRVAMRRAAFELSGLAMGIVGFGGTGREIAQRARGFGMEVRAVDALPVKATEHVAMVLGMDSLPDLLGRSDVVAVCTPLTEETRHLFDRERFGQMKPGSVIVNVTRGEIIELDALMWALEEGPLGGAALDVAEGEPLPADHPIFEREDVVMTPHTAGASQLRAGRNLDRFCENLRRHRAGRELVGLVDKQAGF